MVGRKTNTSLRNWLFLLAPLALWACSDDGTGVQQNLRSLVGVWDAIGLQVPNPENLLENLDVIQEGGSYSLSVLGSGQYTAVFDLVLIQGFEVGTIEASGQTLILTPTGVEAGVMTGSWMFDGDVLIIDALRELDLDDDGQPEVVPLYVEFVAREG